MMGENQRISHIQMERQYQLTFFAPLLLFAGRELQNMTGILAVWIAIFVVWGAIFWMKRKSGMYRNLDKYMGRFAAKVMVFFYQVFLVIAGVWVAAQASKLVTEYMIQGVPRWLVLVIFVLASLAVGKTPEVRGRFAELAWTMVGILVGLFLFFGFWQGAEHLYTGAWTLQDRFGGFWSFSWTQLWKNVLMLLVFLAGTSLFPFLEIQQGREGEKNTFLFRMVGKLGVWLTLVIFLQRLYFGVNGAEALQYPLLDLMAGVRLPGGFVRRLDLIFLTVMLFALLFTMGSICFYSGYLWEKVRISMGRVPILVLIFALVLGLSGCQVVEPERRAYPLVLGIDWTGEEYAVYLAMAKIAQSTGQEKSGSEQETSMLVLEGKDSQEIQKMYDTTEELYLDVGHVQALVLSDRLLADEKKALSILMELEQNHDLGNSAYLFCTDSMEELFAKNGTQIESLGDYLTGLYENRMEKRTSQTLMDIYQWIHNQNTLPTIPQLQVSEDKIELKE